MGKSVPALSFGEEWEERDGEPPQQLMSPHKIISLDEESLQLDETFLALSPIKVNQNALPQPLSGRLQQRLNRSKPVLQQKVISKPLSPIQHGNKTRVTRRQCRVEEDEKKQGVEVKEVTKKQTKITEFLQPRRTSGRKTAEALREEKHNHLTKLILKGTEEGLEVRQFPNKGRGIVATKSFFKNEFVVEYAGELILANQARMKDEHYSKKGFVGCYMYYFPYNNQQYCVDATLETGRLGRLINHSRNGNLITKVVEVKGIPRLIFLAKRDIDENEELSYDYGDRSKESLHHHPWLAH